MKKLSKKFCSVFLAFAMAASLLCATMLSANADMQTVENPNPQAAQIDSIQAIRNQLKLVWNDEFGGDIGCGAERKALVTTNGYDSDGKPTSSEVRATAKWSHERLGNELPVERHGQLQHYVIEDGRNSYTEDGVLHIVGQKEETGYTDPVTKKTYNWTSDGLRSSYFDTEDGKTHFQSFRFGMMEARIYTVNGKALEDEDGNPVLDQDGNIQQDPRYSQGLWNGFWTYGNEDMSDQASLVPNVKKWPYVGEIDICEAFTDPSSFSTYDSAAAGLARDENGIIISYSVNTRFIKYDNNKKILIVDQYNNVAVSYDVQTSSYVVADDFASEFTVSGEEITIVSKKVIVKQNENSETYIIDFNDKTIVDTNGNCYGAATQATAQVHYQTAQRYDGSSVTGVTVENKKTASLGGGYRTSNGNAGQPMHGDTGYHTYGVYWTPTQLFYYCDNVITGYYDITDPQYFQLRECPQIAILTFPIGGSVPGKPNPALDKAEYLVDYVRVYQADDGYNTDPNYKGALGFPELNDLDQPISYYQKAIDAYSNITILNIYNSCNIISGANKYLAWSAPFRTSGKLCSVNSTTATIETVDKFSKGKYDVYITGIRRTTGKDYTFSINDVGIGTQMKLSDYAKDKYGREYASAASTYIGTAEITSGVKNLKIGITETKSYETSTNTGGHMLSLVIIKNDSSTPTVSMVGEKEVPDKYNINISNKEKYVSSREITDDVDKEDITMVLVIGQSNSTTGVGYPCELAAVKNGNRNEVSEVTTTPEKNTVYMAKYGQTITTLNDSNDVATLIENEHIGGYSAAFGKKWNELTGEKVVIVQAAVGASGMHEWVKDNTKYTCACGHSNNHYAKAVNQFNACYNALKENYNIKHSFYIWNQGEHDERYVATKKDSIDINTSAKYYEAYKSMHEDLLNDLPLDFGGINIARSNDHSNSMYLTIARIGQYKAVNELKGCYLASRLFENATKDDMDQTAEGSYGIHAIQKTYNAMGEDAATNLYNAVIGNNGGLKSIDVIANKSKSGVVKARFNGNGELIEGNNELVGGEELCVAVSPCGDYKVSYSINNDDTLVDEVGLPLDSVFAENVSLNITCNINSDVTLSAEQETTKAPTTIATTTAPNATTKPGTTLPDLAPAVPTGENMLTGGTWQIGHFNTKTGKIDTTDAYGPKRTYYTKFVSVTPGETYTFVLDTKQTLKYKLIARTFDANGNFIGTLAGIHASVGYANDLSPNYIPSKNVVIPEPVAIIGISVYYANDAAVSYDGQTIIDNINNGSVDVGVYKVGGNESTTAEPTTIATPTTTVTPTTTTVPTTAIAPTTTIAPTTVPTTSAAPITTTPPTTTVVPTTIASTTAPTTAITSILYGDANSDGNVNLLDLIAMRKHLAKWSVSIDKQATDCNDDGNINLLDLILMRKYLAKWNVVLGPQK